MKKKLAAGILGLVLVIGGATAASAATDNSKLQEIKQLYQQMFNTQKQILQKEVEAGALTQDQANQIQSNMEQGEKYREQAIDNGQIVGPGFGPGGCGMLGANGAVQGQGYGPGYGMRGGRGPGAGYGWRGYGSNSVNPGTSNGTNSGTSNAATN